MMMFRRARAELRRLVAPANEERGQSLTEYGLVLAVVAGATFAVLGMVSPAIFGRLEALTAALQFEGGGSAVGMPLSLPAWFAIVALLFAAAGAYALNKRRD